MSNKDKVIETYFVEEKYRLWKDYQINPYWVGGLSLADARELITKEQAYNPKIVAQRDWQIVKQTTTITYEVVENIAKRDATVYD